MSGGTPSRKWGQSGAIDLGVPLPETYLKLGGRYVAPLSFPDSVICRTLRIPNDPQMVAAVNELISRLTFPEMWTGDQAAAAAESAAQMWREFVESEGCMIGAIIPYATATAPQNTLACDGSTHNRVDYPALYAALDSAFIVDADSFVVPDMRGRAAIGIGQGAALSDRAMGSTGGVESVQLVSDEMPSHNHTNTPHAHGYTGVISNIDIEGAGVPDLLAAGVLPFQTTTSESITINSTGGDQAHENMPPFVALRYCIVAR